MSEEGPSGGNCREEEEATITLLRHLRLVLKTEPPPRLSLEECVSQSEAFPVTFPINTARMSRLIKAGHSKEQLESHINEAYPVIHERLLPLLAFFLRHKNGFGRRKEKCIYSKMDLLELVDRFLQKRPVVFINPSDSYLALDGTSGAGSFEDIGHSHESSRMPMENFISYDEMKFSALMAVSSPTFFINDGSRRNRGLPGAPGSYCPQGIIIGAVGARFEKEMLMEYQDCVIAEEQNTKEKGYGSDAPPRKRLQQEWGRLWTGRPLLKWEEVKECMAEEDLTALPSKAWFNNKVYSRRIQMTAEVVLAEANTRARAVGLKAYLHVVGLGLGVWCLLNQQEALFVDAWGEAISAMDTSHIGHIDFSWISATSCKGVTNGQVFPNTEIVIHFSKRSLHAPVPEGMLLVCTYAWDSNALPGNEYWHGMLSATGDPAAACSSQIAELHNPHINTTLRGSGLRVATPSGVVSIQDYARSYINAREQAAHKS